MIPVKKKREPASFDSRVRQPGKRWLEAKGIPLDGPKPKGVKLYAYWTNCLYDLHRAYDGICAYLCFHIEQVIGAASVDHFVAKSSKPGLAYEWSNYRLACLTFNRNKGVETVLDPFRLKKDTFRLELTSGRIYPEPTLPVERLLTAQKTIDQLRLDGPAAREIRARRYEEYRKVRGDARNAELERQLKRYWPFIWYEAKRQGLL